MPPNDPAQRPGAREATIATATARRRSLSLFLCRPRNDLTGGDLGRVREQGSDVFFYEIRGHAIRFFLCFSSLINAYRNHHIVSFVHPVVRDESRDFTNEWYEFFLYPASRFFRICDAIISSNR